MVNLMKYSAFLVSILSLFFFCQATFAQVQPDNPSKSLDIDQVSQRLSELEKSIEELKKNEKDGWDIFNILGSLFIPTSITIIGFYYSNAVKETESRIKEREIETQFLSNYMDALLSENPKKRTLAMKAISLTYPEKSEKLVAAISKTEPDEEVRDKARESQKILYLVKSKYELEHLYKIHEGENQQRKIRFN